MKNCEDVKELMGCSWLDCCIMCHDEDCYAEPMIKIPEIKAEVCCTVAGVYKLWKKKNRGRHR